MISLIPRFLLHLSQATVVRRAELSIMPSGEKAANGSIIFR
jgi:hypothetical protein